MRALLIVNPAAGRRTAGPEDLDRAVGILREAGFSLERVETGVEHPTAAELAARAGAEQFDACVVAGGDGTVAPAAAALLDTEVVLGILPFGSFMNIANGLAIPLAPLEAAARIAEKRVRRVDAGEANGTVFFETAGIGLDAELFVAARHAERGRWRSAIRRVRRWFAHGTHRVTITIGDESHAHRVMQVLVLNAPYYAWAFTPLSGVRMDDGMLDVAAFPRMGRLARCARSSRCGGCGLCRSGRCATAEATSPSRQTSRSRCTRTACSRERCPRGSAAARERSRCSDAERPPCGARAWPATMATRGRALRWSVRGGRTMWPSHDRCAGEGTVRCRCSSIFGVGSRGTSSRCRDAVRAGSSCAAGRPRTATAPTWMTGTTGSRPVVSPSRRSSWARASRLGYGRTAMTTTAHEPGTYRTSHGSLIDLRRRPDGTLLLEREDGAAHGRLGGEALVKLSDDPDWPDERRTAGDPLLFSD